MKRLVCLLLSLVLLCCFPALAEEEYEDEFGESWEYLESRFGYSLWYNADQLTFWTDEWEGEPAEMLCPWEDESGVAALICRGSRFSAAARAQRKRQHQSQKNTNNFFHTISFLLFRASCRINSK